MGRSAGSVEDCRGRNQSERRVTKKSESSGNVIRAEFGKDANVAGKAEAPRDRPGFVEELYRNHFADLCRTLRRIYGNGPPEPEDLAQQAFEKITRLKSLDYIENPRAFLFKVAINLGVKSLRRIQLARDYFTEQLSLPGVGLEEIDPSRVYRSREQIRALEGAMARLSDKQREIVIRNRFHGHTSAEIARTTGWSEADISRQLKAALKNLMSAVEHESMDDRTGE
jgi:RNA polymerase sigma factor (sigma-70 family)